MRHSWAAGDAHASAWARRPVRHPATARKRADGHGHASAFSKEAPALPLIDVPFDI